MGIIYIVYGGLLKSGWCKIGKSNESINEIYLRYKTYYGEDVKIRYINCDCNDDCEKKLKNLLDNRRIKKRADELFNIKLEELKNIIRDVLQKIGCSKTRFSKYPD